MKIKAFRTYTVICKGTDQKTYRWHLKVEPGYIAWKAVNQHIIPKKTFKGYLIISIDDVTTASPTTHLTDPPGFKKAISEKEFNFTLSQSEIDFSVRPSYSQSFRCQMCGGVVTNDICTDCMFDWDS